MATMSRYWHDENVFESPEMQTQMMMQAVSRGCSRLHLSYPESILLFAPSHCPARHLEELLKCYLGPDPKRDDADMAKRVLLNAHLLSVFAEENQSSQTMVTGAIMKNMSAFGANVNTPITLSSNTAKNCWSSRWKHAVIAYGSLKWTLWEFALHYTYSRTKLSIKEIHTFIHRGSVNLDLDVLTSLIVKEQMFINEFQLDRSLLIQDKLQAERSPHLRSFISFYRGFGVWEYQKDRLRVLKGKQLRHYSRIHLQRRLAALSLL
jgi:hypothetical protein